MQRTRSFEPAELAGDPKRAPRADRRVKTLYRPRRQGDQFEHAAEQAACRSRKSRPRPAPRWIAAAPRGSLVRRRPFPRVQSPGPRHGRLRRGRSRSRPARAASGSRPFPARRRPRRSKSRAHRPLRVVFMRGGIAEIGEHAVAHELGDVALVSRDRLGAGLLKLLDDVAGVLGIEAVGECCGADEVAEQDAQLLAPRAMQRRGRAFPWVLRGGRQSPRSPRANGGGHRPLLRRGRANPRESIWVRYRFRRGLSRNAGSYWLKPSDLNQSPTSTRRSRCLTPIG